MRLSYTVIFALLLPMTSIAQGNSLLWEISGNGLKQPSYLFGTMHLLCADDARLSDSLQHAIDQSEEIFFEIDMDNTAEMMGLFKYIRMKDNKKLSDLLTEAEYARVKKYFSENKSMLPLSMMERFKPFFIASMLSESKMPCAATNGMEEVIMQEVKRQNKPISGLESIAFQASVFDSIPYVEQAKELLRTIDSGVQEDSSELKMLEVYRSQNLDAIEKLTVEEAGLSGYLNLFLYDRNAKWIPSIDTEIRKKPVLIAVGAAHLPGSKGVIQLLRKAGYTLKPVRNAIHQKLI